VAGVRNNTQKCHIPVTIFSTLLIFIIGVGVILVAISGIAWRLTAGQEASSCGAVFGLGRSLDDAAEANRRFVPRLPPSYGRPHHPYAGKI